LNARTRALAVAIRKWTCFTFIAAEEETMWLSKNPFDNYGYFQHPAFMKGVLQNENLDPGKCYQIQNKGDPNSSDQFWVVPVDQQGHNLGPPAFKTAGQVMYSIWEHGRSSPQYNINDSYIS